MAPASLTIDPAAVAAAASPSGGGPLQRASSRRLIRQATRIVTLTTSLLKNARLRRLSELPLVLDRSYVTTAVETPEELEKLRFWQQGDEGMYTMAALEQRWRNRSHPDVWRILNEWWWPTFTSGLVRSPDVGVALSSSTRPPPVAPKEAYLTMIVLCCKALLEPGEDWDLDEAERLANEAWASDSHGLSFLTRSAFNDAIFELADQYTLTTEVDEYVEFLKRLHRMIANGEPPDERTAWKEVEHVAAGALKGVAAAEDDDDENKDKAAASVPSIGERKQRRAFHQQRRAAVTIQKASRSRHGKQEFKQKRKSAVSIQSAARGKPPRVGLGEKKVAAVRIQSMARGAPPRKSLQQQKCAAINIQAIARRILVQRLFLLPRASSANPAPPTSSGSIIGAPTRNPYYHYNYAAGGPLPPPGAIYYNQPPPTKVRTPRSPRIPPAKLYTKVPNTQQSARYLLPKKSVPETLRERMAIAVHGTSAPVSQQAKKKTSKRLPRSRSLPALPPPPPPKTPPIEPLALHTLLGAALGQRFTNHPPGIQQAFMPIATTSTTPASGGGMRPSTSPRGTNGGAINGGVGVLVGTSPRASAKPPIVLGTGGPVSSSPALPPPQQHVVDFQVPSMSGLAGGFTPVLAAARAAATMLAGSKPQMRSISPTTRPLTPPDRMSPYIPAVKLHPRRPVTPPAI